MRETSVMGPMKALLTTDVANVQGSAEKGTREKVNDRLFICKQFLYLLPYTIVARGE